MPLLLFELCGGVIHCLLVVQRIGLSPCQVIIYKEAVWTLSLDNITHLTLPTVIPLALSRVHLPSSVRASQHPTPAAFQLQIHC